MSAAGGPRTPPLEHWFRYPRALLPTWAAAAPGRRIAARLTGDHYQQWCHDASTGEAWQVTDEPGGVTQARPAGDGRTAWWFADLDDGAGVWAAVPVEGGAVRTPQVPGDQALSLPCGSRSTTDGVFAASFDGTHTRLQLLTGGNGHRPPVVRELGAVAGRWELRDHRPRRREALLLCDARPDEVLLWSPHGLRHHALGTPVEDAALGPGDGTVAAVTDQDVSGEAHLVLTGGESPSRRLALPGPEASLRAGADGSLALRVDRRARSELYLLPPGGTLRRLPTAAGSIVDFAFTPDGAVCHAWSDAATPPRLRLAAPGDDTGRALPGAPAAGWRAPLALRELEVAVPYGRVPALIAGPEDAPPGNRAVFLLHGGPHWADFDEYSAERAAWVAAGYTVVQVNYRGSTTYGARWRDALRGAPGVREVADVMAVRDRLCADGVLAPDRCLLAGRSWGGMVALLAAGLHPGAWRAAITVMPLADPVVGYRHESEELRALDRELFGGSPQERPDAYRRASPLAHAETIACPVLVVSGDRDRRCGPEQLRSCVSALRAHGVAVTEHRVDSGHVLSDVALRVQVLRRQLVFADAALGCGDAHGSPARSSLA